MKRLFLFFILTLLPSLTPARRVIDVSDYVTADGVTPCTAQIDSLIHSANDGSVIRFPAGQYLVGTLHLRSHITLQFEKGCKLIASDDLADYDSYRPARDMSRYDSGRGTRNSNLASDPRWTRALILGIGLQDITICGQGLIDGRHIPDSLGEENMRGPHTILLAECRDITVSDIGIRRAANYAILGYELQNARFRNLHISEGWDGIHIRGGKHLRISHCHLQTGDDCIAGGYWQDMRISHCLLNSSCNGIRVMEPSQGLEISHCRIYGPGQFPHLTSGEERRTGTIYGIVLEPGAWGYAPGEMSDVRLHHLEFDNMYGPIAYSIGRDNICHDISISHIRASRCRLTIPFNNQGSAHMWQQVSLRNIYINKE